MASWCERRISLQMRSGDIRRQKIFLGFWICLLAAVSVKAQEHRPYVGISGGSYTKRGLVTSVTFGYDTPLQYRGSVNWTWDTSISIVAPGRTGKIGMRWSPHYHYHFGKAYVGVGLSIGLGVSYDFKIGYDINSRIAIQAESNIILSGERFSLIGVIGRW